MAGFRSVCVAISSADFDNGVKNYSNILGLSAMDPSVDDERVVDSSQPSNGADSVSHGLRLE